MQEPQNKSIAVDKTFSSFDFNDSGNNSCQATVPVSAAGTNKDIPVEKFLPSNTEIRFACSRGTKMVNEQYQFINRKITDSATTTNDYSDASKTGLRAFANGKKTGGVWSSIEKTQHINILELKGTWPYWLLQKKQKMRQFTSRQTM